MLEIEGTKRNIIVLQGTLRQLLLIGAFLSHLGSKLAKKYTGRCLLWLILKMIPLPLLIVDIVVFGAVFSEHSPLIPLRVVIEKVYHCGLRLID